MQRRQKILLGEEAQKKIENSSVAIVGIGALGSVATELLVRAGIQNLLLIDRDTVELSNLQRQVLYDQRDVGKSKVIAANAKLLEINPSCKIDIAAIHLNGRNISILDTYDLILDCTDNLQTRFVLNDYCKKNHKTWIYGAAITTAGYAAIMNPAGACLRCFLQEADLDTCETAGVLNTITTSIAALQVQLVFDVILEIGKKQVLYYYNIKEKTFRTLTLKQNQDCRTCRGEYEYLVPKQETKLVRFCSSGRYQINGKEKDFSVLKKRWLKLGEVVEDEVSLQFNGLMLFKDGRVLVKAKTEEEALSLYSKYVGN